jgi:hypothetical protein
MARYLAAKTSAPTIPIAFVISGDPLKAGVVAQTPAGAEVKVLGQTCHTPCELTVTSAKKR